MKLSESLALIGGAPQADKLCAFIGEGAPVSRIRLSGLTGSALSLLMLGCYSRLLAQHKQSRTILAVMPAMEEAEYFYQDILRAAPSAKMAGSLLYYPSDLRKKGSKFVPTDDDSLVMRSKALSVLSRDKSDAHFVVTYPEALARLVPSASETAGRSLVIAKGASLDMSKLEEDLLSWGFNERDYVYTPGEFALRGSILDIFSYDSAKPYRIDFFGDDVESIRTFDPTNQLSDDLIDSITIQADSRGGAGTTLVPFTDLLPEDATLLAFSAPLIGARITDYFDEVEDTTGFADITAIGKYVNHCSLIEYGARSAASGGGKAEELHFDTNPEPLYHKNFELIKSSFEDFRRRGYTIYVASDSDKQLERIDDSLAGLGMKDAFVPIIGTVHAGFYSDELRLCLFTDHEIFDRYHPFSITASVAGSGRNALTLKELNNLQVGDYVVHIDHGIGRFMGLIHNGEGDSRTEAVKLQYAGGDIVMVNLSSLHKLSKYRSSDAVPPKINSLGSGAWLRIKEKAKKRIKDIARDLIKLYAERMKVKGFAFSPSNYMQRELEASFPYEDTPDQLRAWRDTEKDMEKARPMDRLICGDVGFGKTEIAIRAAFKAACDGKQTAVLVPTTVLALQHFRTFQKRLRDFPVTVDYLTRARTPKEVHEVEQRLKDGQIDIIIGTHKLTGKGVHFHDLGLLVVDEEQKFGVSTKEKLRSMKTEVDTLTLSATPIPRTLQFSLMGARDLSVIRTPPPNRYPIETEVVEMSDEVISEAVNREMARGGQVFYVSPRVSRLPQIKQTIERLVKGARVVIAHGQMQPKDMEKAVTGFALYDYDVLVSTTIVENGIDIPLAGTIIIEGAQNFGLSDLHQMRGRVGRGARRAYCYLIAPPLSALSDESRRRLEAIESFADLGSGMSIALQDLDIRGAGNMLGAEQSGFIADLGYETYKKVLDEAVSELRASEFADVYAADSSEQQTFSTDCTVETDLAAYFPESWVPGQSERIMLYRELDSITSKEELERYKVRLNDRFGKAPRAAEALMRIPLIRIEAKQLGVEKLIMKSGKMILTFIHDTRSAFYRSPMFNAIITYATSHIHSCRLEESKGARRMIISGIRSTDDAMNTLLRIENAGNAAGAPKA